MGRVCSDHRIEPLSYPLGLGTYQQKSRFRRHRLDGTPAVPPVSMIIFR